MAVAEIDTVSKRVSDGEPGEKKTRKKKKKKPRQSYEDSVHADDQERNGDGQPYESEGDHHLAGDGASEGTTRDHVHAECDEAGNDAGREDEITQRLQQRDKKRKKSGRPSKKRRRKAHDVQVDDEDVVDKICNDFGDSGLVSALTALQGEGLREGDDDEPNQAPIHARLPPSQVVPRIFTENPGGGFSNVSGKKIRSGPSGGRGRKIKLSITDGGSNNPLDLAADDDSHQTPVQLAVATQKAFRAIGIFCHGFLAGMAFWHLVMVMVLTRDDEEMFDFIAMYSPMSQPVQSGFFLLALICLLSVLDRYDLAKLDWRQVQKLLTLRSSGIVTIIYSVSLILSLVMMEFDDKLSLFQHNATIFEEMNFQDLKHEMQMWKGLNISRAVTLVVGWILFSLRPGTDLLQKHLRKLDQAQQHRHQHNPRHRVEHGKSNDAFEGDKGV